MNRLLVWMMYESDDRFSHNTTNTNYQGLPFRNSRCYSIRGMNLKQSIVCMRDGGSGEECLERLMHDWDHIVLCCIMKG